MIRIVRNGSRVLVLVKTGLSSVDEVAFAFEAGSEMAAELLSMRLSTRLFETLQEVRGGAFDDGWKRAKSKKLPKSEWFSGVLP